MKNKLLEEILNIVLIVFLLWILISTSIQAGKCPSMTNTELYINIPNSFICNWKTCN